jgi:phosphoglycerate dehydrogenase-like enzyme
MASDRLHAAHQYDEETHGWLQDRLPPGTRLDRLPDEDPWRVEQGTEILLVANGKLRHLSRARPDWADSLRWMHLRPTGLDDAPDWMFDLPHVTVSRGSAAASIAEHVLAALLNFERDLGSQRVASPADWQPVMVGGPAGRSLGLFGFGEIGQAVARLALAFDMQVRATRRRLSTAPVGVSIVPFEELCAQSDHLVLCAPLTPETRGRFDDATFALCRPGQHLVNVARGALIAPEALARALDDGTIARASLDVWNEEPPPDGHWVYRHPRVFLTPHSATRGRTTAARQSEILETNLRAWLAGRPETMIGLIDRHQRY